MQRLLAVLLVLIGLIGLALGRLGETTWAPDTETTATVDLADPGSAVVIDPGVLYVGGEEGEVVIEGASDVSVITAANGDLEAYLEDVRYTRITGASDWTTLSTQEVNPDGAEELSDPTSSDLWRSVDTQPSPYTLDVGEFWAGENGEHEQVYRALLIVTDGTAPGAEKVSITWPVDAENEWVPFAYAGGAAIAVIGLVLLVVSLGGRRRDEDDPDEVEDGPAGPGTPAAVAAGTAAGTSGTATGDAGGATGVSGETASAEEDPLPGAGRDDVREQSVWSLGQDAADGSAAAEGTGSTALDPDEDAPAAETGAAGEAPAEGTRPAEEAAEHPAPADVDRTEPLRPVDDEDQR